MKNNPVFLVVLFIVCIAFSVSCTTFRGVPGGIWTSEEMGVTINFDDDGGFHIASRTATGTILVDGEIREIVIGIAPYGGANFNWKEGAHDFRLRKTFSRGAFSNPVGDEMIYTIHDCGTQYTFVRQGQE